MEAEKIKYAKMSLLLVTLKCKLCILQTVQNEYFFYTSFHIYFWLTLFGPKYSKQCLTDHIWMLVIYHVDMGRPICRQEQWNNRRTKTASGMVGKAFVPMYFF